MYHIQIAGAGYVGKAMAEYFLEKKQRVSALVRSEESKKALTAMGIDAVACDLRQGLPIQAPQNPHFVIIALSPGERKLEAYQDTYLKGVRHYLEFLKTQRRPSLIVYLSSTGVWKDRGGEWVDETTAVDQGEDALRDVLIAAEEQVLNSGLPGVVLRLGGIYGPGRNRLQSIIAGYDLPESRDKYVNWIHRDDLVDMIQLVFNSAQDGSIYNVTDGVPKLQSEFYVHIRQMLGLTVPTSASHEKKICGKRVCNDKIKKLGMQLRFPTVFDGYLDLYLKSQSSPDANRG